MTKENLMRLADEYATLTADTAAVTKARAALESALDEVCRDAARYRWLSTSDWYVGANDFYCTEGGGLVGYSNNNSGWQPLGAAIDAAMKETK